VVFGNLQQSIVTLEARKHRGSSCGIAAVFDVTGEVREGWRLIRWIDSTCGSERPDDASGPLRHAVGALISRFGTGRMQDAWIAAAAARRLRIAIDTLYEQVRSLVTYPATNKDDIYPYFEGTGSSMAFVTAAPRHGRG